MREDLACKYTFVHCKRAAPVEVLANNEADAWHYISRVYGDQEDWSLTDTRLNQ